MFVSPLSRKTVSCYDLKSDPFLSIFESQVNQVRRQSQGV